MLIACTIILDREAPIYYAGEQITGRIELKSRKIKKLLAVTVILLGRAQVAWTEVPRIPTILHDDSVKDGAKERFEGQEVFEEQRTLTTGEILLPANFLVVYNFQITVPLTVPATCQFRVGGVAYKLKVHLKPADKLFDKIFEQELCIRRKFNLNPELALFELKKVGGCINNCRVELSLAAAGFVPGQILGYFINYETVPDAHHLIVSLCQEVTFRSQTPHQGVRKSSNSLATAQCFIEPLHCPSPAAHKATLTVPLTIPFSTDRLSAGNLIKVSYFIIALFLSKRRKDVLERLKIPVFIGSAVPLQVEAKMCNGNYCYSNPGLMVEELGRDNCEFPSIS